MLGGRLQNGRASRAIAADLLRGIATGILCGWITAPRALRLLRNGVRMREKMIENLKRNAFIGLLVINLSTLSQAVQPADLPREPGKKGEDTVEGMDNNHNGVRDD